MSVKLPICARGHATHTRTRADDCEARLLTMPPLGPQRSPPGLAGHDHVLSRAMPRLLALHGPRPAPPRQQWRAGAASAHRRSSFQAISVLWSLLDHWTVCSTGTHRRVPYQNRSRHAEMYLCTAIIPKTPARREEIEFPALRVRAGGARLGGAGPCPSRSSTTSWEP